MPTIPESQGRKDFILIDSLRNFSPSSWFWAQDVNEIKLNRCGELAEVKKAHLRVDRPEREKTGRRPGVILQRCAL